MDLVGTLPSPLITNTPRPVSKMISEERVMHRNSHQHFEGDDADMVYSMTSPLNARPREVHVPGFSQSSKMNSRYTKQKAPSPPLANGILETRHSSELSTTILNSRYQQNGHITNGSARPISPGPGSDLSSSRLNDRPQSPSAGTDLSHSRLNARYAKSGEKKGAKKGNYGAAEQIARKKSGQDRSVDAASDFSGTTNDVTVWVEEMFANALGSEALDDFSDGRSLEHRIKGGGKGVPGIQTQPVSQR